MAPSGRQTCGCSSRPARVTAVGFSLGIVELIETADEHRVVGHLGPDLLGPDWDEDEALVDWVRIPSGSSISALLDQRNLAGIGNMYAAELCFTSGVHPGTPVAAVSDLPQAGPARQADAQSQRRAGDPVDDRQPAAPRADVGLSPRPVTVSPLRHTDPRRDARRARPGASVLLVPELSAGEPAS